MIFSPERLITYHPNEQQVTVIREYSITRLPQLAIDLAAYLLIWFFMYSLFSFGWWGVVTWLVLLASAIGFSLHHYVTWYGDCSIITNQRIIDIERRGLFQTKVREILWEQVTDVQFSQRGLWATVFQYGTVTLFIATTTNPIHWQHVYQPNRLRDILSEYVPTLH
ncbi:MAG: hypothetical protein ACD_43C00128G0002 [uncultured bacterium]|nr:MAG: hypothetical protein ACD_43C00128G0002 [uncultured bacterium]